jgi:hypothetical protein
MPAVRLTSLIFAGCLFLPTVKLPSKVDLCRMFFGTKFGPWCSVGSSGIFFDEDGFFSIEIQQEISVDLHFSFPFPAWE